MANHGLDLRANEQGVWKWGNQFVMSKEEAVLPERCVKCNSSDCPRKLRRTYYWHHPALFLLVFLGFGMFIYLLLALVMRKSITLEFAMCEEHFRKRRTRMLWGFGLFPVALSVLILLPFLLSSLPGILSLGMALVGITLIFVATFMSVGNLNVFKAMKIDNKKAWLKGASDDFLVSLPEFDTRPRLSF